METRGQDLDTADVRVTLDSALGLALNGRLARSPIFQTSCRIP
jgi:hypothetical protein